MALKDSPLEDLGYAYIMQNLGLLSEKYKLNDFPENFKDNILFLDAYCSVVELSPSELKNIPKSFLSNPIFVYHAVVKNPDIYLMIPESLKTEQLFKHLTQYNRYSFLKYATEEQKNSLEYCKEATKKSSLNYQYAPEHIRGDISFCLETFKSYATASIDNITLAKYIPKEKLNDDNFVRTILPLCLPVFKFLPEKYKEDKDLAFKMVKNDSVYFEYISDNLKNDIKYVNNMLDMFKANRISTKSWDIFPHLSIDFFDETFCKKYRQEIINSFKYLPKEYRKNETILKTIFNYEYNNVNPEILKMEFLKYITDECIKTNIASFRKEKNAMEAASTFIDYYLLNKKLDSIPQTAPHTKRNKI